LDGTGEVVNVLIDHLFVIYHGIPWESVFQGSLQCGPVYSRVLGAVQWVLEGRSSRDVDQEMASEMSVRIYQTTQRNTPDDSHLPVS
jgi:hypothetical protein